jgi:hypothetical protein
VQVLAAFFADRLSELQACTNVNLQMLLEEAPEDTGSDVTSNAGSLTQLPPVDTSSLPSKWLARILSLADALGQLQLQGPALEVLSAVVRQDVHDNIAELGKEWFSIRVLGPVEQYVASVPLALLRTLLPSMVSSRAPPRIPGFAPAHTPVAALDCQRPWARHPSLSISVVAPERAQQRAA